MGASELDSLYAHPTKTDENGVLAPWYDGQNGQLDERLRYAIEVYKRYPWADLDQAVMAAPDFIYNSHWSITDEGEIGMPPTNDWMCGDLSQRAWSIVKGLTDYYRYSGDPVAFLYIERTVDYVLDYGLTDDDYEGWPSFPIANPTNGKIRGKCDQNGRMQLDLCARLGEDVLTAYKLTGNERYFEAAKHWADLFAKHCNLDPEAQSPWNRYANPWVVGWSDELTGSTSMIVQFLDAVIKTGYEGEDGALLKAREAGRAFMRDKMLPRWTVNETWGRHYWDWDAPITCGILSMCGDYILMDREAFPNWRKDLRNMLPIIFNRNGVDPNSMGDTYSGAWAFPESATCCGNSLSYCQYTAAPTFIRFGVIADNEWAREIGRRMIIMATYDSDDKGVVKDGLTGYQVATGEWPNLAHPWSLCQIMEALAWMPETFGPGRENHIMRSSSVVNNVTYDKGRISYSTFDAPENCVDVLRLSFPPDEVAHENGALKLIPELTENGYTVKALENGDYLVSIRHDGIRRIAVSGDDPQEFFNISLLERQGDWDLERSRDSSAEFLLKTSEKGASASLKFHGNQVRVIGHTAPDGGWADVYIDGEKQKTLIDFWSAALRDRQVVYRRSGLSDGEHEIKVVARGGGNPLSEGSVIYMDGIRTSAQTGAQHYGSGGGPREAQRMIFGYTKREDYIDKNAHSWRPAMEWVTRSGYGKDSFDSLWTERRSMYIGKADDPEIYRYGLHGEEFWVNVTVGPGKYNVVLHLASTPQHWFLGQDPEGGWIQYQLNADINGERVLDNFNVGAEAGGNYVAIQRTFENIEPKNGIIEIRMTGCEKREAILQALEVIPMTE